MNKADDNNAGLKMLMEAEEQAKQVIERAKAEKVQKLSQAREDAKKRVSEMKATKDDEYKNYLESHTSDLDSKTLTLQQETDQKLGVIEKDFNEHKAEAVDFLTAVVLNIQ
ncbi:Vacuolar ATP synthase subunit G [Entamoeba marina]